VMYEFYSTQRNSSVEWLEWKVRFLSEGSSSTSTTIHKFEFSIDSTEPMVVMEVSLQVDCIKKSFLRSSSVPYLWDPVMVQLTPVLPPVSVGAPILHDRHLVVGVLALGEPDAGKTAFINLCARILAFPPALFPEGLEHHTKGFIKRQIAMVDGEGVSTNVHFMDIQGLFLDVRVESPTRDVDQKKIARLLEGPSTDITDFSLRVEDWPAPVPENRPVSMVIMANAEHFVKKLADPVSWFWYMLGYRPKKLVQENYRMDVIEKTKAMYRYITSDPRFQTSVWVIVSHMDAYAEAERREIQEFLARQFSVNRLQFVSKNCKAGVCAGYCPLHDFTSSSMEVVRTVLIEAGSLRC